MKYYVFWIETDSGERTEWRGLTAKQAMTMYESTNNRTPYSVRRYGWEEAK